MFCAYSYESMKVDQLCLEAQRITLVRGLTLFCLMVNLMRYGVVTYCCGMT